MIRVCISGIGKKDKEIEAWSVNHCENEKIEILKTKIFNNGGSTYV